jgi:hypothetical protein
MSTEQNQNNIVIHRGLNGEWSTSRIYRVRPKYPGGYLLGMIEVPPLSMI